jgi:LemA protein
MLVRVRVPMWVVVVVSAITLIGLVLGSCVLPLRELASLQDDMERQWALIQGLYGERAALAARLVETARELDSLDPGVRVSVSEACGRVQAVAGAVTQKDVDDAAALERYREAQGELSVALSRLMSVAERYPDLTGSESFRELRWRIEAAENQIAVESRRFDTAAERFNARRKRMPAAITAAFLFHEKARFGDEVSLNQAPDSPN